MLLNAYCCEAVVKAGPSEVKALKWEYHLVSCPGNKFQNLNTTVVPVQSHLARSVSSQKALDMSQLWKVLLGHDTSE